MSRTAFGDARAVGTIAQIESEDLLPQSDLYMPPVLKLSA